MQTSVYVMVTGENIYIIDDDIVVLLQSLYGSIPFYHSVFPSPKSSFYPIRLNSKWDLRRLCKTLGAVALPRLVSVVMFTSSI